MTGTRYVPGTWLGILRGRTAVLLGPDTPPATAGALWDLLGSSPEVHEILHAVTSSSGGSLTRIPSFGILDFAGPLRVFLRGDLDLAVDLPDGRVELDGRDVTTWNERRFALPEACRLSIPHAGSAGQPELPLGEGVVLLQSLALVLGPGHPELAPAPVPQAAVVVDPAGIADVRDAPPAADDAVGLTMAPEDEASVETVLGVLDDDLQDDGVPAIEGVPEGAGVPEGDAPAEDGVEQVEEPTPAAAPGPVGENTAPDPVPGDSLSPAAQPAEPVQPEAITADSDQTSSYDHLWERTVMRSIEDAAVRDDGEDSSQDDSGDARSTGAAQAAPQPAEPPAVPAPDQGDPETPHGPTAAQASTPSAPAASAPAASAAALSAPAPIHAAPAGVLIDSVPWKKVAGAAPEQATAPVEPSPVPPLAAPPLAPPLAPVPAAVPAPPAERAPFDDDHDGQTVMKSSLAASAGRPLPTVAEDASAGPTVLARVCSQGHPNPPTRSQCSACGAALLPDAVQVSRPRLGRARLSTGELLDLDQSLIIGRQPSVSRVQGGVMPRLVQVPSPEGDISRSHVEVRLEGWHVMLCDLKATNGTVLVREGQQPRRLAQNEMAILLDGDIAELGDNISLRFEEIP